MSSSKPATLAKLQSVKTLALIKHLEEKELERDAAHLEAECSYTVLSIEGGQFLQLDSYGSSRRKMPGKKSQSIRFSLEAIRELRKILSRFPD